MGNHPCHCSLSWIIVSTWDYLKGVPGRIWITASLDKGHRLQCPRAKLRAEHSHLKSQVPAWECSPKLSELLVSFKRTQKSDFHMKHLSFLILIFKGINLKTPVWKPPPHTKKAKITKTKQNLWDDYGPGLKILALIVRPMFLNIHTHWNYLESLKKKKCQCFIQPPSRPNASKSLGVGPGHQDWLQPPWWLWHTAGLRTPRLEAVWAAKTPYSPPLSHPSGHLDSDCWTSRWPRF